MVSLFKIQNKIFLYKKKIVDKKKLYAHKIIHLLVKHCYKHNFIWARETPN